MSLSQISNKDLGTLTLAGDIDTKGKNSDSHADVPVIDPVEANDRQIDKLISTLSQRIPS